MATRRAIVAVMDPIAFVGLLIAGFVSVGLGLAGLVTAYIGTHIGSRIAIKRGEKFVTITMAITILIFSVILLISA